MLALDLELVKGSILGKHYKVEAFLGEGGFGIVAKCRDTTTNQAVAIKTASLLACLLATSALCHLPIERKR
uniref:Protein kinase domain-containing protein n=1 Tax=Maylandia zebra TaxID=106582 RepID=A0A3P9BCZ7_9CICH